MPPPPSRVAPSMPTQNGASAARVATENAHGRVRASHNRNAASCRRAKRLRAARAAGVVQSDPTHGGGGGGCAQSHCPRRPPAPMRVGPGHTQRHVGVAAHDRGARAVPIYREDLTARLRARACPRTLTGPAAHRSFAGYAPRQLGAWCSVFAVHSRSTQRSV